MSDDGDIVRDIAGVPTQHHDRCNSRDGRECDCYMTYWQPLIAALARMEAAEAQRDALAKALRRIADPTELTGDGVLEEMTGPASHELWARINRARAALAETGIGES